MVINLKSTPYGACYFVAMKKLLFCLIVSLGASGFAQDVFTPELIAKGIFGKVEEGPCPIYEEGNDVEDFEYYCFDATGIDLFTAADLADERANRVGLTYEPVMAGYGYKWINNTPTHGGGMFIRLADKNFIAIQIKDGRGIVIDTGRQEE